MKRNLILFTVVIFMLSFSGCSLEEFISNLPTPTVTGLPTASPTPSPSPVPEYEPSQVFTDKNEEEAAKLVDGAIAKAWEVVLSTKIRDNYEASPYAKAELRGDSLTGLKKQYYDEIIQKIKNLESFEYTERNCPEVENFYSFFLTLEDYFREDHREVFLYYDGDFTSGYKSNYFLPGENPSYNNAEADYEEIRHRQALLEAVTNRIINNMPEGLDAYDQYRYLGLVICELCTYDKSTGTVHAPYPEYNCLVNGTCVCSGYARAFQYLCQAADLYCEYLTGRAGGGDHAWNLVKLNGETYYVDMTWADNYDYYGYQWRDYFCMTQGQLEYDHDAVEGVTATGSELPDYVRNN